jgi:radical SAM superfamily enzyme YgiQ (UPF0313 family)
MNLTLVSIHIEPSSRAVPLGAAMLAASLHEAFGERLRIDLVDLYLEQSIETCVQRILAQDPDWVGLSLAVWNRAPALRIAEMLKAARPELVILAGGPETTADRVRLASHPTLDLVLPGEGERLMVETAGRLLAGCSPAELKAGIRPAPVADLGRLPSPWLDGTLDPGRYGGLLWELSRGCPFKCDFCFESLGAEGVRRFPVERLRAELELFARSGASQVFVLDPTFNFNRDDAKRLLRLMGEAAPELHYSIEIRSEFLDEEMAALFAGLNCSLQIGLQSADPGVLTNIHRSLDPRDFERKIMLLHEAGTVYGFDLIYGLPGDTLDGFLASLDFALSLAPNHLDIFPLAVLPGTRLADTAPGFGLVHEIAAPYLVVSSPTFSEDDMARAARIAEACDLFYNKGAAVPWFGLLLENLQLTPSQFLVELADWLAKPARATEDPLPLQQIFLRHLFAERDQPDSGRIAADIAAWFGHTAALTDPTRCHPCETPAPGALYLNPDSRFARFATDPLELLAHLEGGISDFEELAFFLEEKEVEALVYLHEGEVEMQPLTGERSRWLKSLPLKREDAPPAGELAAFLIEARAKGIVLAS